MAIRPVKEAARDAFRELKKYQSGEISPVRTGREWLDDTFGGLIPGDIVTIGGISGGGKSYELQKVKNFIMNQVNNPNANDFVWLDYSLEMRLLSTIIRELHETLNKSKRDILTKNFTEVEANSVRGYYEWLSDGRFFIEESTSNAKDWEKKTREFLSQHTDKKAVCISVDHIALQINEDGGKKDSIDDTIEAINGLKKEFPNVIWFILSQLNREILKRIKDKDMMAMPNRGDFYQSDTIFHVSDYVYVSHNPNRIGINQFLKVNTKVYDYISQHFTTRDTKNRASFETLGNIFYIVLKMREGGVLFKDIFIESIEIPQEYLDAQEEEVNLEKSDAPVFTYMATDIEREEDTYGPGF